MANHYIRDGGSGNGSAWNNALDDLPASLTRGDTYYIADGSYAGYTFDDAEDGTTLITVKKATVADHGIATGWQDSYGDGKASFGSLKMQRGYYLIDGQTRNEDDWKDDDAYGFYSSQIYGQNDNFPPGGNYITVKYASLGGAYSETFYSDMEEAVYCGGFAGDFHHWTISHCFLHNSVPTIIQFAGVHDQTVEYCFLGPGWGKEAIRGQNNCYNCIIRHNTFYDSTQYDPDDATSGTTAEIGIWSGGTLDNNKVYGNVFTNTKSSGRNAVIVIGGNGSTWVGPGGDGTLVYNNTFTKMNESAVFGEIDLNGSNTEARNNLAYNLPGTFDVSASTATNNTEVVSDPFVDYDGGDYHLSDPTDAGDTLPSPYDIDRDGNARGVDGWDLGAYEYGEGTPVTPPTPTSIFVRMA